MGSEQNSLGSRWLLKSARWCVAGLFGYALTTKLINPGQLLKPFEYGLGLLSSMLAGVMFVLTVLVLVICLLLLLLRRGSVGFVLSGVFFIVGAVYSVYLSLHQYQGGCGCGVSIAKGSEHELMIHAYQNTACAVLTFFIGFRAGRLEKGEQDESEIAIG